MNTKCLESIETFLKETITNRKAVYIFPTDVVAKTWADWCVTDNHTSVKAVALERFTAWDKFKGTYVSAKMTDKMAIPSILRKLFVQDFIKKNSLKDDSDETKLKKIIAPELASEAATFSDWISKNLPSLNLWQKRIEEKKDSYGPLDDEDKDYQILFNEYNSFLQENDLFEPSWVSSIEISDTDSEFYIFYPEQLEDFADFSECFSKSSNITALTLPPLSSLPQVYLYPDARKELRQTMLQIIQITQSGKADWSEIALTVPDLETYRPYLERELSLYQIPYKIRAGLSFTKNSAGKIFKEIQECYNSDFSFDSVRALLLDERMPWKDTITLTLDNSEHNQQEELTFNLSETKELLIREANRMRCLCSFEEYNPDDPKAVKGHKKVDIWERSFNRVEFIAEEKNNSEDSLKYKQCIALIRAIKTCVRNFFENQKGRTTFKSVKKAWLDFKKTFFNEEEFTSFTNDILGRCISELDSIVSLEDDFIKKNELDIDNPFNFFVSELEKKSYTPQQAKSGISVFPYKLSASAYFKYQFVINASQTQLDVPYKRLSFLNSEKRKKLGLLEEDRTLNSSQALIQLYAKKVQEVPETLDGSFVHFSCSEDAFGGFAIPHCSLAVNKNIPNLDEQDFILQEKHWLLNGAPSEKLDQLKFTPAQKNQLLQWMNKMSDSDISENDVIPELRKKIDYHLIDKRNESLAKKDFRQCDNDDVTAFQKIKHDSNLASINSENANLYKISAREDMENFFPCPRKWLFKSLLKFHDDTLDLSLMSSFDMGSLNHKILEFFMADYLGKTLPYYDEKENQFIEIKTVDEVPQKVDVTAEIQQTLSAYSEKAIKSHSMSFADSPLVIKTLNAHKKEIGITIFNFLKTLLRPFGIKHGKNKDIGGIGNCTIYSKEDTLTKVEENYVLFGKADLVLKSPTPSNCWILIDYKNSESSFPKSTQLSEDGILKDFQMPLYYKIVKDGTHKEIGFGYYYAIKDSSKKKSIDEIGSENAFEQFQPTMDTFDNYSQLFTDSIADGKFTPLTSSDKSDKQNVISAIDCMSCNFKGICRTTYTVAGNKIQKKGN